MRAEQFEAFSRVALRAFEDRLLPFIATHFPDQVRRLGDERTRVIIQNGIDRARHYGLAAECDVCRYIALMFMLGPNFDSNPEFAAMRAVLEDSRQTDPGVKIKTVYAVAEIQLRKRVKLAKAINA
jgi:hypothetical protein